MLNDNKKIQFYVSNFGKKNWMDNLQSNLKYPCIILVKDNWNDYGYKTTYEFYYLVNEEKWSLKGSIKILQKGTLQTTIPNYFETLTEEFCTLGQSFEYYRQLKKLDSNVYTQILKALNDIVFNSKLSINFESEEGFTVSLLRFSEAEKVYNEAASLFSKEPKPKNFNFRFSQQPTILD